MMLTNSGASHGPTSEQSIDTVREPFLILDPDLRVLSANKTFYRFFHVTKKDTEGMLVYDLGDGEWNIRACGNCSKRYCQRTRYSSIRSRLRVSADRTENIPPECAKDPTARKARQRSYCLPWRTSRKQKELKKNFAINVELNAAVSDRTKELELRGWSLRSRRSA